MSWYDRYFTEEWEKRFYKETRSQFAGHPHLINDAFQNAWGKLFEKLKDYPRKDTSDALVFSTFRNLLKDERREHFGRCRPKSWVNQLGPLWNRTAKQLCQTGLPAHAIAEKVCCHPAEPETDAPCLEQVKDIIPVLESKPYCSTFKSSEEWTEEHQQGDHSTADEQLSSNELRLLINLILQRDNSETNIDSASEHILVQWQSLSANLRLSLDDDERLLLTLIYIEGYAVAKAARALNIKAYTVRYQLKQTLQKIRQTLEKHEIDMQLLN